VCRVMGRRKPALCTDALGLLPRRVACPPLPPPPHPPSRSCRVNFPEHPGYQCVVDELEVLPLAVPSPAVPHTLPAGDVFSFGGSGGVGVAGAGGGVGVPVPPPPAPMAMLSARAASLIERPLAVGQAVRVRRAIKEPV
jgi:hypothetical protein